MPSIGQYSTFVMYFVLARFGVAAIPGGGILVIWPVLSNQLGFNTEMLSLIHALYIMFDCILTTISVMGNGAFALLFCRIYNKIDGQTAQPNENKTDQTGPTTI